MRAKKDEKIHDMAMEQKRRMEGAKKSGQLLMCLLLNYLKFFQELQISLQALGDSLELTSLRVVNPFEIHFFECFYFPESSSSNPKPIKKSKQVSGGIKFLASLE